MIEFFFSNAGALDGTFGRNRAEFLGSEVFQLAAIAPEGCARAA